MEYEATRFRMENLIGPLDPVNCKRLILALNILTLYKPMSDDFSGMCLRNGDKRFMLINSNHQRGRQHFTIAHELYHLFIQKEFTPHICNPGVSDLSDPVEATANLFAACLLMPRDSIYSQIPKVELDAKNISLATILKLEQYFSVSHSAMLVRLISLNLITKEKKEEFSKLHLKMKASEYGYELFIYEPGNEGVVLGDYGVKTKNLFDLEKISESHYLELMAAIGIDPSKFANE